MEIVHFYVTSQMINTKKLNNQIIRELTAGYAGILKKYSPPRESDQRHFVYKMAT